jgi:hypothetical protein
MPVGIQSDGLPRPATSRSTASLPVGQVARRCQRRSGSFDFSEAAELPIGDPARPAPRLTREQVQISLKFLVQQGGTPVERLMRNGRIEVLSSSASYDAGRPVPPAFHGVGPVLSDRIEARRHRHGA